MRDCRRSALPCCGRPGEVPECTPGEAGIDHQHVECALRRRHRPNPRGLTCAKRRLHRCSRPLRSEFNGSMHRWRTFLDPGSSRGRSFKAQVYKTNVAMQLHSQAGGWRGARAQARFSGLAAPLDAAAGRRTIEPSAACCSCGCGRSAAHAPDDRGCKS